MKNNYISFLILLCFTAFQISANNDKYRLIIADDPATTITIGWNQTSGSNPQVYYGTTDHGSNYTLYNNVKSVDRSVSFRGMNNRFARLTGLTPNSSYYFVIHDSQGVSQRFWFKTAPNDLSRLSFIAGGDSRNNRTPRQRANLLVSKLKPHGVFFGGDMTDDDTSSEWQNWFDDWQLTTSNDGRMIPIVAARGNHEYDSSTVYNLFDTPTQDSYYAITFGDNLIRTYTLNSEISVLGSQLTWLQNDLSSPAGTNAIWKMAQYHKPMRPHTSGKSEGNSEYNAWAQLFYDNGVNLVVDCDSHLAKTTYPIKPSNGPNSEEGFEIDNQFGTVYTGEGSWGAPLRSNNDDKSWTRSSGSFNQFKLIFIDENKIELRTIKVDNAVNVGENPNDDPFQLPNNLDVFSPSTGAVVNILSNTNNCPAAGTACDDGDPNTLSDVEDGFCNCSGVPQGGTLNILVADDAEEGESGSVYLDSSDIEMVFDSFDNQNNQTVGLRFANIPLPGSATINSAYIQFTVDESNSENTSLIIRGEDAGNSSFFSSSNNNITNRSLTSAQVNWNNIPGWSTGDSGINQRTPDLSAILSEVLSNSSWTTNNAITFIISGSGVRTAESIEGSSSNAARLIINYSISDQTSCNSPSNLASSNIDLNSIDLTWDAVNEAGGGYQWVVMPNGISPGLSNALADGVASNASAQVTGLSDNTNYDIYVRSDCGNGDLSEWSNVLDVTTLENICNIPANLSVGNISELNATLNWDMVIEAGDGYEWVVMSDGVLPDSSNALFSGLTSNLTVQVAGFSNLTTYDAYVRSVCGSGNSSEWSPVEKFTINTCPPAGTTCDDGNSNTINDTEDGSCNCSGVIPGGSLDILVSEDAEEGESGAMYLNSSDVELVFDSFDNQNNQTVGLRFANISIPNNAVITNSYIQFTTDETDSGTTNLVINGEYSGNASSFSTSSNNISARNITSGGVSVAWNNVPAWNSVGESGTAQRTPDLSNIVEEIVAHPNWSSSNAMVFIITGTGTRTAESLDGSTSDAARLIVDYTLTPTDTTCDAPLNLTTSNVSTESVDLSWDTASQASSGYDWVVMSDGVSPDLNTALSTGTTSGTLVQVTGLSESTNYDAYVRSNCGDGEVSSWSVVQEFTTVAPLICIEPSGLLSSNVTLDSVDLIWDAVSVANNGYEWVIMDSGIPPNISNAQFTGTSSNEFAQIAGLNSSTSYDAYVRSNCGDGEVSSWSVVQEFTTMAPLICIEPSSLLSSNVTLNSVDLIWDTVSVANNGYEWVIMDSGIPPNISNAQFTGTSSNEFVQVAGLTSNTTYDVYVRSNCAVGNVSGWSNSTEFTTDFICNVPTNLTANNLTVSSATLTWDMVILAEDGYEWVVMPDGVLPDSSNALFAGLTSNLTVQVAGLSNLTTYDAYVRSVCGSGNNSEWSPVEKFTINTCPPAGTTCDDGNSNTINDIEDGSCNCSGVIPGGSLDILVSEDAEEGESGAMYLNSSDVELVFDSFDNQNNQTVGLRFANISIPNNAVITNSYIQFTTDETDSGTTNLVINGEYSGNASSFSTSSNNISARNITSGGVSVAWNNVPAWNSVGESGTAQRTPDLSNIVEEIVAHPNWSSSNAMVFIITGTGTRTAESLDGSTSDAARLIVDYTLTPTDTTCDAPLNLTTSNVSTESVDLSWDTASQASSGYEWVVMSDGVSPDLNTALSTGTTSGTLVQVTGLSESTNYDAYVRSNCGDGEVSGWSKVEGFTIEDCGYTLIDFNNFDSGWGIWNDGGSDCRRSTNDSSYAYSGNLCVRLRDNTSSSVMTTDELNLLDYDELMVSFTYLPISMDNSNEDFWLQISTNGGSSYTTIEEWNYNDEFLNNNREFDAVTIAGPFSANTRLRFRCDASGNRDLVYIDDVEITGCYNGRAQKDDYNEREDVDKPIVVTKPATVVAKTVFEIKLYPNPVNAILNIDLVAENAESSKVRILDILGREQQVILQNVKEGDNNLKIDLSNLSSGYYFIEISLKNKKVLKKIIKR